MRWRLKKNNHKISCFDRFFDKFLRNFRLLFSDRSWRVCGLVRKPRNSSNYWSNLANDSLNWSHGPCDHCPSEDLLPVLVLAADEGAEFDTLGIAEYPPSIFPRCKASPRRTRRQQFVLVEPSRTNLSWEARRDDEHWNSDGAVRRATMADKTAGGEINRHTDVHQELSLHVQQCCWYQYFTAVLL